jgi:hypothetical protein
VKKLLAILLLTSVALAVYAAEVTVLSITGSVEIKEPGGLWSAASAGQVVSSRSMVSTGFGSRARLSAGGMELNLQPLTRITLDSLTQDGGTDRTEVSLQAGRIRATRPPVTRTTRREVNFRVSTPVATAAVRGTDFTLSPDKLITAEGLVEFSQGQAVVLSPGGTFTFAVPGLRPIDPADLVDERWKVSTSSGSGKDRSDSGKSRGYARISLE